MTKLTLLFLVVCAVAIEFFNIADSQDAESQVQGQDHDRVYDGLEEDDGDGDRSGATASAHASASVGFKPPRPGPGPGPRPGPGPAPAPPQRPVECYVCTDCPKILANTTTKLCPITFDGSKQKTCVVYAEQYKHMKKPWYIRGCASERGSCNDIRQAHSIHSEILRLNFCNECEGDRCNTSGASRSLTDFTMAFFALVVTPLVAKYTLA